MSESIFSKIISREIPSNIVYEDEHVIAFLDIHPVSLGHTLVVPKNEQPNLFESSEEDMIHILRVVRKLGPVIQKAVRATGCNMIANIGSSAGQVIFHTHVHLIPRHEGDGLKMWPHMTTTPEELKALSEQIQALL